MPTAPTLPDLHREPLAERLCGVRARTLELAEPLSAEDQCVQSMPDASPTKWHLAHTSWFFEAVVLQPWQPGYCPFDDRYARLFNSYYESLGPRHPRPQRGLLTRPSLAEVHDYRAHVDRSLLELIRCADADTWRQVAPLIELGLQHEQQHQELILTDVLHLLSMNPLAPAYRPGAARPPTPAIDDTWWHSSGGDFDIGHDPANGFSFDNECPRHPVRVAPFSMSRKLVTNRDVQAFIDDDGYSRPSLWLSDGWAAVQSNAWRAPLYWCEHRGRAFTLHGEQALAPEAPACHLSFYEAAAIAEWAGARLPTEFEWEIAARSWQAAEPADAVPLVPAPPSSDADTQCFGAVWQWTRSSYDPYPRFRPFSGVAAEYNGKFMVGQMVLRGSSVATPPGHARVTYRNFFPPSARWQFSGVRLARDA